VAQTPDYPSDAAWPEQYPTGLDRPDPKTSGMAIAALVCGLFGLLTCCAFVPSILGIVFGSVSLVPIRQGAARGWGLAVSGIVLGVLGLLAGTGVWIIGARAPEGEPIPGTEVSEADRRTLESMQVLEQGEQIELLYASGMFSLREGGAVITAERLVSYQTESDVQACPLADIRAIDVTLARSFFEEGQFVIERDDGALITFSVTGISAGDRLFHRVLKRRANEAREAAAKPPVASKALGDSSGD
jgi:hypothetical protein